MVPRKGRGGTNQDLKSAPLSSIKNQTATQPNVRKTSPINSTVAMQTAQVIAANGGHPRQRDVSKRKLSSFSSKYFRL